MSEARVATMEELVSWRADLRAGGKRLVLTNGVFDLLHVGHLRYLAAARALGDALIVAVDSDESVKALAKGDGRPYVTAGERAELLAALRPVDRVVIFAGPGAMRVIEALRPEIYVKGGDYADGAKALPERTTVESYGGTVAFIPLVPGRSTTDLVARIREA